MAAMTMIAARRLAANAAAATACSRNNSLQRAANAASANLGASCVGTAIRHSSVVSTSDDGAPTSAAARPPLSSSSSSPQSPAAAAAAADVGSYVSGSTTHFGYESVSIDEKEGRVKKVFENVADNYDVMNDFMSAGLHRVWKDELLRMTGVGPMAGAVRRRASLDYAKAASNNGNVANEEDEAGSLLSILDVAGGTGDVAFRFVDAAGCPERAKSSGRDEVSVTVCDINPEMLRVGEARARRRYGNALLDDSRALGFVEGNAQELPFDDASFDLYTIAFGLRNVTDVDMALGDAMRVLKPGGRFLCLEFSHVTNAPLAALYDAYSFGVIPKLGEVVANDRESYQYLVESIRKFCTQDELVTRLEAAGFEGAKYTNMTGGIVAVHEGWKPL